MLPPQGFYHGDRDAKSGCLFSLLLSVCPCDCCSFHSEVEEPCVGSKFHQCIVLKWYKEAGDFQIPSLLQDEVSSCHQLLSRESRSS